MRVSFFRCAELLVSSPLDLAAPLADPALGGVPDVEVIDGGFREVPNERPSTDVVAERVVDGDPWYTFARSGDLVIGRVYGLADFEIAGLEQEGRTIRVTFFRAPGTPVELIAILIAGTVVAYLLCSEGRLVLHASAVEANGRALAFVGQSGQGKTTMATLMCADGYPLVADDLLPVDPRGDQVMCVPTATELRVREKVEELLGRFDDGVPRRRTVDERHAVAALTTRAKELPLSSVVIPWPDREATEVSARRLAAGEAAMTLARCQRVEGWSSASMLRKQFDAVSAMAATVPVLVMKIPWGPPFRGSLAGEVLMAATGELSGAR